METAKKKKDKSFFQASLPKDLHRPIRIAAAKAGVGLSVWIADAIRLKLADGEDGK